MFISKNSRRTAWYTFGIPGALFVTAWIVLIITLIVCIFEIFDSVFVHKSLSFHPGQLVTSICFSTFVLVIIFQKLAKIRAVKFISLSLSILILIFAGVSITEYVINLFNDELSVKIWPNGLQISLMTSVSFFFLCIALIFVYYNRLTSAQLMLIPVSLIAYFFLLVHILGAEMPVSQSVAISLDTCIALMGICIALIMLYPDTWLMRVFTAGTTSFIIARQLLIPSMIIPIIVGCLRLTGERNGLFTSEVGVALVAMIYTCCFTLLVWLTTRSVNKLDRRRMEFENALRESEDRFRTIAETLPVQIAVTRINDAVVIFSNEAYDNAFGYKKGEVKGKNALNFYANPDDRSRLMEILITEGKVDNFETQVVRADGSAFWIIASIRKILFEGEPAYLSALIDIDQLKNAQKELLELNRILNALGKCSQAMMQNPDERKYLNDVCRIITEDCGYMMVWIGYARQDADKTVEPIAYYGFDHGYIEKLKVTWADTERGRGPTGTAIRNCKPVVCRDMQNDPDFAPWREEAVKRGYASSIVLPLIWDDKAFGAISIYSKEPDAFDQGDINLLNSLAHDLAYGITHIQLAVSERNALKSIKESEAKYRQLFDEMTEGFALHEIILNERGHPCDYKFISVNPAFERLTGMKAEAIIGKTVKQILPNIESYWIENYGQVALTGQSIEFEDFSAELNSHYRVSAFCPKKGSFAVIFENITKRVVAENEVKAAKQKLDLALDNANIGIWTWNIRNDRFECDVRINRMFGIENEAEIKKFEDFEKCIFEEDQTHFNQAISKALEKDITMDTIFRRRHQTGEVRYVTVKAKVDKDSQGRPYLMTGVCLDITAMRQATENTLINLNTDLLRSNKELEQFAYVASHDLQEPLRMVSSFTQLLASRYNDKLDQQAREFINFAVDGAQRMQRLINDLLEYSRVKTRGKSLAIVDMNEVFRQTLHNLSLKIKEKKAIVTSKPLPSVFADDSQMVQLFQNLIENGIKFCSNKPKICISAFDDKEHYRFSIRDNGIGIQPQYYERIFQIFQRLHLREEYGGTGIGLAICKRIVERHGGKIWVQSNGHGTDFQFTIKKV